MLSPEIPSTTARNDPHSGTIAILGATGAVGQEALAQLAALNIPPSRILALASEQSAGRALSYGNTTVRVSPLRNDTFAPGPDAPTVAIFASSTDISRTFAPLAAAAGTTVIDNSSAFRLAPGIPLIVPEINGDELSRPTSQQRIIANPNCSTIILLMAIHPLRAAFGISSINVATYQAVSGAGLAAMDELREQAAQSLAGHTPRPSIFKEPCAFNVFSHDSDVDAATGVNGEERKIIDESRKILRDPSLEITPTCIRVPVLRAHTQAISLRLSTPATEHDIRRALSDAPGLELLDDRAANNFPTPLKASNRDAILIGRIRPDPARPLDSRGRSTAWCLLACGDQIRKGAATNAIQIAQHLGLIAPCRSMPTTAHSYSNAN